MTGDRSSVGLERCGRGWWMYGRRAALLAPVWDVGSPSTLRTGRRRDSVAWELAQCAQFSAFRFVLTFCISALCVCLLLVSGVMTNE